MLGLILSELILFTAAGLIGFALGMRAHAAIHAAQRRAMEEDVAQLRSAVAEAQVRRARGAG